MSKVPPDRGNVCRSPGEVCSCKQPPWWRRPGRGCSKMRGSSHGGWFQLHVTEGSRGKAGARREGGQEEASGRARLGCEVHRSRAWRRCVKQFLEPFRSCKCALAGHMVLRRRKVLQELGLAALAGHWGASPSADRASRTRTKTARTARASDRPRCTVKAPRRSRSRGATDQ